MLRLAEFIGSMVTVRLESDLYSVVSSRL